MKLLFAVMLLGGLAPSAGYAQKMNADDVKWINQCIEDNKGEAGATPAIIRAYCICMNEKMPDSKTRSISEWEKSHPVERRACDRQAGWK